MDLTENASVQAIDTLEDYGALQRLGDYYTLLNKYNQARHCYEKAALIEPDEAAPYVGLAAVALDTDKLDDAENAFRVAIRLDRKCAKAYAGLASVAQRRGRYQQAFEFYLKCLEIDCDNLTALLGLFQTSCQMGSFEKIIHYLCLYLAEHPKDTSVMFTLAVLYIKDRKLSQARRVLLSLLEYEPDNNDAVNFLEEVEHSLKQKNRRYVFK